MFFSACCVTSSKPFPSPTVTHSYPKQQDPLSDLLVDDVVIQASPMNRCHASSGVADRGEASPMNRFHALLNQLAVEYELLAAENARLRGVCPDKALDAAAVSKGGASSLDSLTENKLKLGAYGEISGLADMPIYQFQDMLDSQENGWDGGSAHDSDADHRVRFGKSLGERENRLRGERRRLGMGKLPPRLTCMRSSEQPSECSASSSGPACSSALQKQASDEAIAASERHRYRINFAETLEEPSPMMKRGSRGSRGSNSWETREEQLSPMGKRKSIQSFEEPLSPMGRRVSLQARGKRTNAMAMTDLASTGSQHITIGQLELLSADRSDALVRAASDEMMSDRPTMRSKGSMARRGMHAMGSSQVSARQEDTVYVYGGVELEERVEAFLQFELDKFRPPPPDCGMISPVGRIRVVWEILWAFFLAFEMWMIPFQVLFYDDALPTELVRLGWVSSVYFMLDIVMNFNTGMVSLQHQMVIMRRPTCMVHYAKTWFVPDVLASIPWDMVGDGDDVFSTIRALKSSKVSKAFRVLKILKLLRVMKVAQTSRHLKYLRSRQDLSKLEQAIAREQQTLLGRALERLEPVFAIITPPLQCLALIAAMAHFFGCIYAALRQDVYMKTAFHEGVVSWYDAFLWAYSLLVFGGVAEAVNPGVATLELCVLSIRIGLVGLATWRVVFFALVNLHREVAFAVQHRDAMQYLKARRVSAETQLSVLHSLRTTINERQMQSNFHKISEAFLPEEVRRSLCEEMWVGKLVTLGLIRAIDNWEPMFVRDLAQLAREEVFAPRVVVFKHGDAAHAAYHVAQGELAVMAPVNASNPMPFIPDVPFTAGMWIGEKSLLSLGLRRNNMAFTRTKCVLLTVPSTGFFSLLEAHDLESQFDEFCSTNLWRGFCGRCGMIGDHFSDECPQLRRRAHWAWSKFQASFGARSRSASSVHLDSNTWDLTRDHLARDLKMFLVSQDLGWLEDEFLKMEVMTLDDLRIMDFDELRERLASDAAGRTLTPEQEDKMNGESIENFLRCKSNEYRKTMKDEQIEGGYLIFLSHYKLEAGTEAALMKSELEQLVHEEQESPDPQSQVFLDSEDLTTLEELQDKVLKSQNVALLLTAKVLTRPWVLVELVTAIEKHIPVLPVKLIKEGTDFNFPDQGFYDSLLDGSLLGEVGTKVVVDCGFTMQSVVDAIKAVTKRIALQYSPHRPSSIRREELRALLHQCVPEGSRFGPAISKQASALSRGKKLSRQPDPVRQSSFNTIAKLAKGMHLAGPGAASGS